MRKEGGEEEEGRRWNGRMRKEGGSEEKERAAEKKAEEIKEKKRR